MDRSENRGHLLRFARGQLGPLERKSLEPMALADGINPRRLQFFFNSREWREDEVRETLQRHVASEIGDSHGIFVIDETSDAKKGHYTAAVARQYCGESGKIDNCIVSVHTTYVGQGVHALIDGELFLPPSWNPGQPQADKRRKRCAIPDHVRHRTKAAISMGQLRRALGNGMSGQWVSADEHYGGTPWWRNEVAALGLYYVVEIPRSTYGWTKKPVWALPRHRAKTGRPLKRQVPSSAPRRVEHLADKLAQPWKAWRVHDTQKGSEVWEFIETAFYATVAGQARSQGPLRLLVGRHALTGEIKYFLSNAPPRHKLSQLVSVAFSRWRVERCFQDCKGELGMNHAEIRSWRGLSRHYILTAVNYFFLVLLRREWGEKSGPGSDDQPAQRRDSTTGSNRGRRPAQPRANKTTGRKACRTNQCHPASQPPRQAVSAKAPDQNLAVPRI